MGILNRAPAPIDTDRPAAADFVRVLATWAVGAFHIWQQSWYGGAAPAHWLRAGSVGVDLLVMLSAFCLFLPWANAAVRNQPLPRIRPAEFYRRRALRLHVADDNAAALAFYRRYGFDELSSEPGSSGRLLLMEKKIGGRNV